MNNLKNQKRQKIMFKIEAELFYQRKRNTIFGETKKDVERGNVDNQKTNKMKRLLKHLEVRDTKDNQCT